MDKKRKTSNPSREYRNGFFLPANNLTFWKNQLLTLASFSHGVFVPFSAIQELKQDNGDVGMVEWQRFSAMIDSQKEKKEESLAKTTQLEDLFFSTMHVVLDCIPATEHDEFDLTNLEITKRAVTSFSRVLWQTKAEYFIKLFHVKSKQKIPVEHYREIVKYFSFSILTAPYSRGDGHQEGCPFCGSIEKLKFRVKKKIRHAKCSLCKTRFCSKVMLDWEDYNPNLYYGECYKCGPKCDYSWYKCEIRGCGRVTCRECCPDCSGCPEDKCPEHDDVDCNFCRDMYGC